MDNITNDAITDEILTNEEEITEEIIEFEPFYNKHYIRIDEQNRIIHGFSDAFEQPQEGDICINEQGGYQFRLYPNGEENPALYEWNYMIPLYKWDGENVVARMQEEIDADIAALPEPEPTPTMDERVSELEAALMQTDEIAIELYEAQAVQEEINIAQDEALIEIYELIGG